MLVLLKLVTPPLVPVSVLPVTLADRHVESDDLSDSVATNHEIHSLAASAGNAKSNNIADTDISIAKSQGRLTRDDASRRPHEWILHASIALLGVSMGVSVAIWLTALSHLRRVRRLLRGNSVRIGRTIELLHEVTRLFNLRCAPTLCVVNTSIPPMLWAKFGSSSILLPRQLVDSLDDAQLRNIFAHEIAHIVRRDHWSDLFAFIVVSLFWWNPIAWLARREAAVAAETCCDALALKQLDCSRRFYAKTLLAVVDFVTLIKPVRPKTSIAFGDSRLLKRRFAMLADSNVKSDVSRVGLLLLVITGGALILVPARAQETSNQPDSLPSIVSSDLSNDAITGEVVRAAIDRGVQFLKKQQDAASGAWPEKAEYDGGVTSLCTLSLLRAGVPPEDPCIQAALKYLRLLGTPSNSAS